MTYTSRTRITNTGAGMLEFSLEPSGDRFALLTGDSLEVVVEAHVPGMLDLACGERAVTLTLWPGSSARVIDEGWEIAGPKLT
jgi:hypothetical protein